MKPALKVIIIVAIIGVAILIFHSLTPTTYPSEFVTDIARICDEYYERLAEVGQDRWLQVFQCMKEYGIGFTYYGDHVRIERIDDGAEPFR